jgi:hypothetical protein
MLASARRMERVMVSEQLSLPTPLREYRDWLRLLAGVLSDALRWHCLQRKNRRLVFTVMRRVEDCMRLKRG